MVEIITFIIDLLIIAGVVFAVLFIRKRLSQHPGRKYMLIAFLFFLVLLLLPAVQLLYTLQKICQKIIRHTYLQKYLFNLMIY